MARTKMVLDAAEFQKVVNELEGKQQFPNLTALWKAVEASDWARNMQPRPITASVAYAKARELKISHQTKAGKKGRPGGFPAGSRGIRKSGSEKMSKYADSFAQMRKEIPARFHHILEKAEKGSKIAAVKLKCLDCVNWETREIKLCPCVSCSLYPIRPYQGSLNVVEAEEIVEADEIVDDESC